jgi:sterol desaturase/sphingolipid hydroxylase (fatty acid hydroxylase superfamily)
MYSKWCTILSLILGELPIILFTYFDWKKFDVLKKYRIVYPSQPNREYPTNEELKKAMYDYSLITFGFLLPLATFSVYMFECPWNLDNRGGSNGRFVFDYIWCSIVGDILFTLLHMVFHHPKLYFLHKHHHSYEYNSFALVNHVLHPLELLLFIIPPTIPTILLQPHILVVWWYNISTNWIGIYIHSGYSIPLVDTVLGVNSRDHDTHHVKKTCNYSTGIWWSFFDRLIGTYKTV